MHYTCPMPETIHENHELASDQPTRLIVGMSRAGTTWVSKELSRHPEVISYGETMFWGRKFRQPDNANGMDSLDAAQERLLLFAQYFANYAGHARSPERRERYESSKLGHVPVDALDAISEELRAAAKSIDTEKGPAELFAMMNGAVCHQTDTQIAIESTPNHLNALDRIFDALPEALVVAMLREPYAFMVSYKHQGDRKEESVQRTFRRLYHPLFCAMIWRRYSKSAREALGAHESTVRTVWLDDLQAGGGGAMRELAEFLQIPNAAFFDDVADHATHKNTSFPGGKRPELSHSDMFWMNLIVRKEMKHHGLTKANAGFHPLAVLGSILKLPISAYHAITIMGKRIEGSPFAYAKRLVFGK
jgi:hypothetical protein